MTRTPAEAIAAIKEQSAHGPRFEPNLCKRKTRQAYLIPSDGSKSASEAWSRTDHRFDATKLWIPGGFAWWTGGSDGNGHVGILAGQGYVWSVDILRPGYWDRVTLGQITRSWPRLRAAGFSLDIDGVQAVKRPAPPPPKTPHLDAAIRELLAAREARKASASRDKLDQAIALVRQVRGR